jgi:hypothetical protein
MSATSPERGPATIRVMKAVALVFAACLLASCSQVASLLPSKAPTPQTGAPTPAPTFDLQALAREYLIVAGDSNDAHAILRKQCSGTLTLKQQKTCWAKEAEIERTLLKAYTELQVPPELEADFAALRQAVAAYETLLRKAALAKTNAEARSFATKIQRGSDVIKSAANKVRSDLSLPLLK